MGVAGRVERHWGVIERLRTPHIVLGHLRSLLHSIEVVWPPRTRLCHLALRLCHLALLFWSDLNISLPILLSEPHNIIWKVIRDIFRALVEQNPVWRGSQNTIMSYSQVQMFMFKCSCGHNSQNKCGQKHCSASQLSKTHFGCPKSGVSRNKIVCC